RQALLDLEICQRFAGRQCLDHPARLAPSATRPGLAGGAAVFGRLLGRRRRHAALAGAAPGREPQIGRRDAVLRDLAPDLLDHTGTFLPAQFFRLLAQLCDLAVVLLDLGIDFGERDGHWITPSTENAAHSNWKDARDFKQLS